MKNLVCEGGCNNGLVELFDEHVHSVKGDRTAIDPSWLDRARRFVHTLHTWVSVNRWRCTACGTVRKFND